MATYLSYSQSNHSLWDDKQILGSSSIAFSPVSPSKSPASDQLLHIQSLTEAGIFYGLDPSDCSAFASRMISENDHWTGAYGVHVEQDTKPCSTQVGRETVQTPGVVSSENLSQEVLPELEVDNLTQVTPFVADEDGLAQFFNNGDEAWLPPSRPKEPMMPVAVTSQSTNSTASLWAALDRDFQMLTKPTANPLLVARRHHTQGLLSSGFQSTPGADRPSSCSSLYTNFSNKTTATPASLRDSSLEDSLLAARSSVSTNSAPRRKKKKSRKISNSKNPKRKLGRPPAFPQKLYKMLTAMPQEEDEWGLLGSDIVGFVPDGSGFQIYDIGAFVELILPKYFKISTFSSFQRQLQLYDIKRATKGGPYMHPFFHRDAPENLPKVVRKQEQKMSKFLLAIQEIAAKST